MIEDSICSIILSGILSILTNCLAFYIITYCKYKNDYKNNDLAELTYLYLVYYFLQFFIYVLNYI